MTFRFKASRLQPPALAPAGLCGPGGGGTRRCGVLVLVERNLTVVERMNDVNSGAVDAIYWHLSSDDALASRLFVGCAHLSWHILARLFERLSAAASAPFFRVDLVHRVTEATNPAVLSRLLGKVGSGPAQLACR